MFYTMLLQLCNKGGYHHYSWYILKAQALKKWFAIF